MVIFVGESTPEAPHGALGLEPSHTVLSTSLAFLQLSQAGDLIMEVYIEQQLPDNCVTLKVSLVEIRGTKSMRGQGNHLTSLVLGFGPDSRCPQP